MIKVRLQGLPHEIDHAVKDFHKHYDVLSVSDPYENRKSKYIRVYIEMEMNND